MNRKTFVLFILCGLLIKEGLYFSFFPGNSLSHSKPLLEKSIQIISSKISTEPVEFAVGSVNLPPVVINPKNKGFGCTGFSQHVIDFYQQQALAEKYVLNESEFLCGNSDLQSLRIHLVNCVFRI
jgi:hypothetical protein